ncbi:MAG TPA: semialdehyde dehydrogenase, partial [Agriterribacter sp.]|nr:semialdehyde dehydrogenase [Agriterribacter sp.]
LLHDHQYGKIRALVRKPLPIMHPKLEVKVTDFGDAGSYRSSLGEGDVIFCCIGTTMKKVKGDKALYRQIDMDIPVRAAQYGLDNGFSQYLLVSAIGANATASNFYLQLKGSVEDAIITMPYAAVHIFRPSLLLGDREEHRRGESMARSIMPLFSMLMAGSLKKYKPVQALDVAKAMLAASKTGNTGTNIYEYPEIKMLAG